MPGRRTAFATALATLAPGVLLGLATLAPLAAVTSSAGVAAAPVPATRAPLRLAFERGDLGPGSVHIPADIWAATVGDAGLSALLDLTNRSGGEWEPAFSPDGRRIAYLADDGEDPTAVVVANADGSNPRPLPAAAPAADGDPVDGVRHTGPTWSPDGSMLAYVAPGATAEQRRIVVVRVSDGRLLGTVPGASISNDIAEYDPAWSPTGNTLAFVRQIEIPRSSPSPSPTGPPPIVLRQFERRVWLVDVVPNGPDAVSFQSERGYSGTGTGASDAEPAWSPDGQALVFGRGETGAPGPRLVIGDLGTPPTIRTVFTGELYDSVGSPAWSPDGRLIAFSSRRGRRRSSSCGPTPAA